MDANCKHNKKMDFVRLETEIRSKAAEYLDDITEENIKAFSESTKFIAQSILENYYLEVDDFYSNGVYKIEDSATLNSFIDFRDGYRSKMKKWMAENEIKIGEMKVKMPDGYSAPDNKDIIVKTSCTVGVGTLVAVGLLIFTEVWIAVAAELLALGVAYYVYKDARKSQEKEFASRIAMYEKQIECEKSRLVNGLIKDLKLWLANAEQYSNNLLNDYNIE